MTVGLSTTRLHRHGGAVDERDAGDLLAAQVDPGGWLAVVAMLGLLAAGAAWMADRQGVTRFAALATDAIACTWISTGLVQVPVSRWLAEQRRRGGQATWPSGLAAMAAVQVCLGFSVSLARGDDARLGLLAMLLHGVLGSLWLVLQWTHARAPLAVSLRAQLICGLVTLAALAWPGDRGRALEQTAILALGLSVVLLGLLRWASPTGPRQPPSSSVWSAVAAWPGLAAAGLLAACGPWADGFLLRLTSGAAEPAAELLANHDTLRFLAYATTLPLLGLSAGWLETGRRRRAEQYARAVAGGLGVSEALQDRCRSAEHLQRAMARLLRAQLVVTFACMVFAGEILGWVGLPLASTEAFQLHCAGACLHGLFLLALKPLLADGRERLAIACCVTMLGCNLGLCALALRVGPANGHWFPLASLLALVCTRAADRWLRAPTSRTKPGRTKP